MQKAAAKNQKKLANKTTRKQVGIKKPSAKRSVTTKAKKTVKAKIAFRGVEAPATATVPLSTNTRQRLNFSTTTTATTFPTFSEGPILTELADGGILVAKFNNPSALNSMNVAMGERMVEILNQIRQDNGSTVKALVLTGMGRAFSAGGDLKFLKERSTDTAANNINVMLQFYHRFLGLRTCPVPTIAAINGPAVGAGAAVASLTDYRISTDTASIGWAFTGLGLHPGMASTFFLPKMTSPSVSTHLLLSGEIIGAPTAKDYGIINQIIHVDGDDIEANNQKLLSHALSHAQEYTKFHSLASLTLLKNLRAQQNEGLEEAIKNEAFAQALTFASPEYHTRLDKMINRKK